MAANLTAFDKVHAQNAFRSFVTRFPFLVYAALTLLVGWAPWYLTGEPGYLFFVPLLTALIMAPLVGGREGLLNFLRRMVRVRAPWYTWIVALLLPGAIALAAIAIHVMLGGQAPDAALLIGLMAVVFIVATRAELGKPSAEDGEPISNP